MRARSLVAPASAVLAGLAGIAAAAGALSPWFRFSVLGVSVNIRGTNTSLDGRYALALGAVAIFVAGVALGVGRDHVARVPAGVVLAVVGLAGLALMWHQGRRLKDARALLQSEDSFKTLDRFLATHNATTWGYWLDLWAFAALVLFAVIVAATGMRRSDAAQRTAVDRYDAPREV
jgi:hypothetical protein